MPPKKRTFRSVSSDVRNKKAKKSTTLQSPQAVTHSGMMDKKAGKAKDMARTKCAESPALQVQDTACAEGDTAEKQDTFRSGRAGSRGSNFPRKSSTASKPDDTSRTVAASERPPLDTREDRQDRERANRATVVPDFCKRATATATAPENVPVVHSRRSSDDEGVAAVHTRQDLASGKDSVRTTNNPGTERIEPSAQASKSHAYSRSRKEPVSIGHLQTEHIRNLDSGMARRMGSVESDVHDLKLELKTGMSEMKDMFTTIVQGMSRDRNTESVKVPSVSSVIQTGSQSDGVQDSQSSCTTALMMTRIPHFDVAFNRTTLRYNIAAQMFQEILHVRKGSWATPEDILTVIQTVVHSLDNGKGEKRSSFKTGIGARASDFRRRVMVQAVFHAQRDTFKVFQESKFKKDDTGMDGSEDKSTEKSQKQNKKPVVRSTVPVPRWLHVTEKTSEIRSCDIDAARNFHQSVNGNAFSKRMSRVVQSGNIRREDDALFAMHKLYSTIGEVMTSVRRVYPNEYFELVGYLFADWDACKKCRVTKQTLEVFWTVSASDYAVPQFDSALVPDATTLSQEDMTQSEIDAANEDKYKTFVAAHPELELIAAHDVYVRANGKRTDIRHHPGSTKKYFRHSIHLMDVAGFIVRSLTGFPHHDTSFCCILKYHARSLFCLYQLALVLRDMVQHQGADVITEFCDSEEEQDNDPVDLPLPAAGREPAVSNRGDNGSAVLDRAGDAPEKNVPVDGNTSEPVKNRPTALDGNEGKVRSAVVPASPAEVTRKESSTESMKAIEVLLKLFNPNLTNRTRGLSKVLDSVPEEVHDEDHLEIVPDNDEDDENPAEEDVSGILLNEHGPGGLQENVVLF